MANVNQNLDELENDIITAKTTLATNLSAKGAKTEPSVTLTEMANNVNNITINFSNPFETIGYTDLPPLIKNDLAYSQSLYNTWDATQTEVIEKFNGDKKLVYCPLFDTSNVQNISYMISNCDNLIYVPMLNTSNVRDFTGLFDGDKSLIEVPQLDTKNAIDVKYMFRNCESLKSVPQIFTDNCEHLGDLYNGCKLLTEIPSINTSKAKIMSGMFKGCYNLKKIPDNLDMGSCVKMLYIFDNCRSLTVIPPLNTQNVDNMEYAFTDCTNLERIEGIDFSSVTNIDKIFGRGWDRFNNLSYILIKNLGKSSLTNYNLAGDNVFWGHNGLSADAKQSLTDSLITYSFDRKTAGMEVATITLPAEVKAKLTEEEISQIEAKGYTVTTPQ